MKSGQYKLSCGEVGLDDQTWPKLLEISKPLEMFVILIDPETRLRVKATQDRCPRCNSHLTRKVDVLNWQVLVLKSPGVL